MLRRARAADSQFDSMSLPVRKFRMTLRGDDTTILEHDPEKWAPVFPRDKREAFARRSCSNKKIERDDDSKKNHPALAARGEQNTSLRRTWNKPDRRRGIARRPVLCRCWPGRHVASCGVGCPGRHGIRTFCDHAVPAGVGLCELPFPARAAAARRVRGACAEPGG